MSETVNRETIHKTIFVNLGGTDLKLVHISHSNKPGNFYWGYLSSGMVVRDVTWTTPGAALNHLYDESLPEMDPKDY